MTITIRDAGKRIGAHVFTAVERTTTRACFVGTVQPDLSEVGIALSRGSSTVFPTNRNQTTP